MMRNPSTDWMLPPEAETGEFEQRWNVAPDRRMPMAEMFSRGGMPGMESYGEADPAAVFGAYDKAKAAREKEAAANAENLRAEQYRSTVEGHDPSQIGGGGLAVHRPMTPDERTTNEFLWSTVIPQSPLDAGLMVAGGPVGGKLLRGGAAALGALFEPDEAEAAPKYDPRFWHGISGVKLRKPISEMFAEKTPTQVVAERFISPEALQGGVMLPAPGDRAQVGERLLGVGGKRLDIPTELQGGHGYMPANVDKGHVWASDQGVISTMGDRLKRLSDQYANVYLPYSAMGERSVDFSHHMSDTLAEMVKDAKIQKTSKDPDKVTAATFNQAMREPWGDFPKPIEKFPGILSPDLRQWLIDAPGKTRSKFAQLMDQAPYQGAGFPDVAEARFAVTDPRLLHEPTGAAGLSISRPNPNAVEPSGHRTYSTALGGEYVGGFERSIPRDVMFPDIVKAYAERKTKHGQPFNPSQQDYAFRMGTPPFFQETNDQWLEGVMRYLEATRNAQR